MRGEACTGPVFPVCRFFLWLAFSTHPALLPLTPAALPREEPLGHHPAELEGLLFVSLFQRYPGVLEAPGSRVPKNT